MDEQQTEPTPSPEAETNEQPASWSYNTEAVDDSAAPLPSPTQPVEWTASEFIDHDKRVTWFFGLAGVALIVAALAYLITRDMTTTVVIVIAAALFGVTAGRKPGTLTYRIDEKGITIGPKHYPYAQFKSFSVIDEGALGSIQLIPVGRFAPPISLYYPPDQEDQIVNTLGSYLPHDERKRDTVDRLMHRIRF